MLRPTIRILCLVVALGGGLFVQPVRAVILEVGNGNVSGNNFTNPDGSPAANPTVPGYVNVGLSPTTGGSVTYLGDGWILTANHVSFSDANHTVSFQGNSFTAETDSGGHVIPHVLTNPDNSPADLVLYHLTSSPALPSLISSIDNASPSGRVIMIGNGRNTAAQHFWTVDKTNPMSWVWNTTASQPGVIGPNNYSGFDVSGDQLIRWGENAVSATGLLVNDGFGTTNSFATVWSNQAYTGVTALPYEAQASPGDSGGAVMALVGGQWELSGIMYTVNDPLNNQPAQTALFGDVTYIADLSKYRSQILAIVPEPGSATLALAAALALPLFWRRVSPKRAP